MKYQIDSNEIYTFPEDKPLNFAEVALIGFAIVMILALLAIAVEVVMLPPEVKAEVLQTLF